MSFFNNIDILGYILIFVSFLFGIKLPDWDFKLKLRHRSIITHSPLITILLICLYKVGYDYFFKFFIIGFSMAISVHIIFDLFPSKWQGGALLKIPINITCDEKITKLFFVLTILINSSISIFYMTDIYEYFFVVLMSIITFFRKKKYEKSFYRPILIYLFLMLFLANLKYDFFINLTLKFLNTII